MHLSLLVIAACALSGWWLAVRPNASYRGVSGSISFLIVFMAVLLCFLALSGQSARAHVSAPQPSPTNNAAPPTASEM